MTEYIERKGYNRLWMWFSLSYSSWLTIPRSMMHEMPDDWQDKMAALMEEWDETWDSNEMMQMPCPYVVAKRGNKFTKWPSWLLNYRYPDFNQINKLRNSESVSVPHEPSKTNNKE